MMAFPPITPLPVLASGLKPDANGELWNASYLEIDANFDLLENVIPTEYWDGAGFSVPSGTGSANGHVIQDEGISITQRANLDFIGASVSATDGGSASEITINGAILAKNIEALSGNKTLTDADEPIQVLTPDADRDVNLPAEAVTNPYFLIVNPAGSGFTLTVKDDSPATITIVHAGQTAMIIPDGVAWYVLTGAGDVLTTEGDMLYQDASGLQRLPAGTIARQVMKQNAGLTAPEWVATEGTSFPGSPYTGQRFFRTDLGFQCYYDGADWVTVELFTVNYEEITVSALDDTPDKWLGDDNQQKYVRFEVRTYVDTTNSGANYWSVLARSKSLAGSNSVGSTIDTSADAPDTHVDNGENFDDPTPANYGALSIRASKTGSPGSLSYSVTITYRLIIT